MTMLWTLETEGALREMWATGAASREIANKLGTTRNAVIGKARRMGLSSRGKTFVSQQPAAPTRAERKKLLSLSDNPERKPLHWSPMVTRLEKPSNAPVGILDVAFHHCRAVVGADETSRRLALFCGAQIVEGKSYCPYHQSIYYQKVLRS